MKCKCGHSFCWQCMKPWKPTHTDYYNCTAKISKAAADHRKFTDYNQRCTAHHKSKVSNTIIILDKFSLDLFSTLIVTHTQYSLM